MKAKQTLMDFGGTDVNVWPGRAVDGFIAAQLDERPTEEPRLMETILERGNMLQALKRVEGNKGAPGVDGMTTAQLRGYLNRHWDKIKDRLMMRLAARVKDKRVLKLIRAYLNSGALVGGVVEWTGEGTPQGGPLSPLLANIVLDELDKELERRGLRFVRCVRLRPAKGVSAWQKWSANSTACCAAGRDTSVPVCVKRWRRNSTTGYGDASGHTSGAARRATGCRIRRQRAKRSGNQWKLPRTRVRNLMQLGIVRRWAVAVGNTRKGAWRLSKNGTVCAALPDDWFTRSAGVILLGSFCQ